MSKFFFFFCFCLILCEMVSIKILVGQKCSCLIPWNYIQNWKESSLTYYIKKNWSYRVSSSANVDPVKCSAWNSEYFPAFSCNSHELHWMALLSVEVHFHSQNANWSQWFKLTLFSVMFTVKISIKNFVWTFSDMLKTLTMRSSSRRCHSFAFWILIYILSFTLHKLSINYCIYGSEIILWTPMTHDRC